MNQILTRAIESASKGSSVYENKPSDEVDADGDFETEDDDDDEFEDEDDDDDQCDVVYTEDPLSVPQKKTKSNGRVKGRKLVMWHRKSQVRIPASS